jgi:hypothetical protein
MERVAAEPLRKVVTLRTQATAECSVMLATERLAGMAVTQAVRQNSEVMLEQPDSSMQRAQPGPQAQAQAGTRAMTQAEAALALRGKEPLDLREMPRSLRRFIAAMVA